MARCHLDAIWVLSSELPRDAEKFTYGSAIKRKMKIKKRKRSKSGGKIKIRIKIRIRIWRWADRS